MKQPSQRLQNNATKQTLDLTTTDSIQQISSLVRSLEPSPIWLSAQRSIFNWTTKVNHCISRFQFFLHSNVVYSSGMWTINQGTVFLFNDFYRSEFLLLFFFEEMAHTPKMFVRNTCAQALTFTPHRFSNQSKNVKREVRN